MSLKNTEPWQPLLQQAHPDQHIAQVYRDERFLVDGVSLFAGTGLQNGDGVILAATRNHLKMFTDQFRLQGVDVERAKTEHRLILLVAEDVLPVLMQGSPALPNPAVFRSLIAGALQRVRTKEKGTIRVYGELVNEVWLQGNLSAALAIEELWHRLSEVYSFSLLCGYSLDPFNEIYQATLARISQYHSHMIPVRSYEHLEAAFSRGSRDILGDALAGLIRRLAQGFEANGADMPPAQRILLWAAKNMPVTAAKILARTREYYGVVEQN